MKDNSEVVTPVPARGGAHTGKVGGEVDSPTNRAPGTPNPGDPGPDVTFTAINNFLGQLMNGNLPLSPGFSAFEDAYRRGIEVASEVSRFTLDGMFALAQRQMEIVQQAMADFSEANGQLVSARTPAAQAACYCDWSRRAWQRAAATAQQASELIQSSQNKALGVFDRYLLEALDNVKARLEEEEHRISST